MAPKKRQHPEQFVLEPLHRLLTFNTFKPLPVRCLRCCDRAMVLFCCTFSLRNIDAAAMRVAYLYNLFFRRISCTLPLCWAMVAFRFVGRARDCHHEAYRPSARAGANGCVRKQKVSVSIRPISPTGPALVGPITLQR